MKTYFALVHHEPGMAYGVTFPDLPGCFSASDDVEGLIGNACEALALWFEDAEEVAPSSAADLASRHAGELSAGAFLIAVPRVTTAGKLARVNISLDRGMLDAIDTAATARRLTRSAFLAEAARNEIEARH
jgi:predicted RNase H-like HicB family nuclease